MSKKRIPTKAEEQNLKSKLSFIIVILMVLSLTMCNTGGNREEEEKSTGSGEETSFRLSDSTDCF
jgi:hypothetical protein